MAIEVKDWDEYQALALRTLKPDTFLQAVRHCAMGMAGEIGEYVELPFESRDKRIGEIGDCLWYSAVLANVLGYSFQYVVSESLNTAVQSEFDDRHGEVIAQIYAARLIDRVKKNFFYDKPLDSVMVLAELVLYVRGLHRMCEKDSVLPLHAALLNIKKLDARYKDGRFDASHAINRDTQAESEAAGIELV